MPPAWIIFSDLDGTLLDAHTYRPDAAQAALRRVQVAHIPVILCSAKTAAEQAPICAVLDIKDPYIVENGSAIVFENGQRHELGLKAADIIARLDQIRRETPLDFVGFHEMSTADVAAITGLSPAAARLAQQRDYSATICTPFSAAALAQFRDACQRHGLHAPSGGRFYTVTGRGADKGAAVRWLLQYLGASAAHSVGIGDSPNDTPLLLAVARPYLVQRPDQTWHDLPVAGLVRVPKVGPHGWAWAIDHLLG